MSPASPRFAAVLCDLDGVLCDSEPLHIRAWQQTLVPSGLSLPDSWFLQWVGITDRLLLECLLTHHGWRLGAEETRARKREIFHALVEKELRVLPGVSEGLAQLRAAGVALSVATSSGAQTARHELRCIGLLDRLPVLVTADDVARLKPAPDCYLLAAQLLGVAPQECAALEDSPSGISAATAAGCHALAVATSLTPEALAGARRIFPGSAQALEWLAGR